MNGTTGTPQTHVATVASSAAGTVVASTSSPLRCWVCYTDFQSPSRAATATAATTTIAAATATTAAAAAAAGITPCHHDEICGPCHLRMRHLHNDIKCPICKTPNELVIVDYISPSTTTTPTSATTTTAAATLPHRVRAKVYEDYPVWGHDLGRDFVWAHTMFFPVSYYRTVVQPLVSFHCTVQNCSFGRHWDDHTPNESTTNSNNNSTSTNNSTTTTLRTLQAHLRKDHRLVLCSHCVEGKRDFVSALPRYSPSGLQRHMDHASAGHPVCEFCRPTRFYDVTALYTHLNKDHYKCHVCEQLGQPNQFFRHYQSLERHFDQRHFLCPDPQCLAARFGVYANELDLRAHQRQIHGGAAAHTITPLQLEFRLVRNRAVVESSTNGTSTTTTTGTSTAPARVDYSMDGTPFEPAAVAAAAAAAVRTSTAATASAVSDATTALHPQHVARTEVLRLRAMELRRHQLLDSDEEAFPTLPSQSRRDAAGPVAASEPTATAAATATTTMSTTAKNRLTVGWTSDGTLQRMARLKPPTGAVTDEEFPSLTGGSSRSAPKQQRMNMKASSPLSSPFSNLTPLQRKPAATSGNDWSGAVTKAAAAAPLRTVTPPLAIRTVAPVRQALDLSAGNFPSLSGGSGGSSRTGSRNKLKSTTQPLYAAAQLYSAKANKAAAAMQPHTAAHTFPSLKATTASSVVSRTSNTNHHVTATATQSLSSDQFPALSSTGRQVKAPKNAPTPQTTKASYAAADALAQKRARERAVTLTSEWIGPPLNGYTASTASAETSVHDVKAVLGPSAYKLLKQFTRQFASHDLAADAYVDHAASLFPQGYSDANFWTFVPALIASCPVSADKDAAKRYLDHLQRMRNGALNAEAVMGHGRG